MSIYALEHKMVEVTYEGAPLMVHVVWYPGHALDHEDFAFAVVGDKILSASYYVDEDYIDMELFGWAELCGDADEVIRQFIPNIDQKLIDDVMSYDDEDDNDD